MTIDEIIENFEFLDDWDDRYRYLIELGRELEPMRKRRITDANKVRRLRQPGLAGNQRRKRPRRRPGHEISRRQRRPYRARPGRLTLAFFSGRPAKDIVTADAQKLFRTLGFEQHLTPQRSNGLRSMVERIKHDAARALATA